MKIINKIKNKIIIIIKKKRINRSIYFSQIQIKTQINLKFVFKKIIIHEVDNCKANNIKYFLKFFNFK